MGTDGPSGISAVNTLCDIPAAQGMMIVAFCPLIRMNSHPAVRVIKNGGDTYGNTDNTSTRTTTRDCPYG